jgi:hypothetical protein
MYKAVARRASSAEDEMQIRRACIASASVTKHLGRGFERWFGEIAGHSPNTGSGVYLREIMQTGAERTLLDLVSFPSSRRQAPYDPLDDIRASVSVAIEALSLLAQAQACTMFCHNAFGPHAVVLRYDNGKTGACKFHSESGFPRAVLCDLFQSSVDAATLVGTAENNGAAMLLAFGYDGRPRTPHFARDVASFLMLFVHAATRRIRLATVKDKHKEGGARGGPGGPPDTQQTLRENDVRFVLEFAFFFLRPIFPGERLCDLADARRLISTYCPFARTDSEIDVFPSGNLSVALGPTDRCLVYDTLPPTGFNPPETFSLRTCLGELSQSRAIAALLPCSTFKSSPMHCFSNSTCHAFNPTGEVVLSPRQMRFPSLRDAKAVRRFIMCNYSEGCLSDGTAFNGSTLDSNGRMAKGFIDLLGGPDQALTMTARVPKRPRPAPRARKSSGYDPEETSMEVLARHRRDFACTDTNVGYDPAEPSIF